jgi:hypothetical protein
MSVAIYPRVAWAVYVRQARAGTGSSQLRWAQVRIGLPTCAILLSLVTTRVWPV